jgi:hypothetical protein
MSWPKSSNVYLVRFSLKTLYNQYEKAKNPSVNSFNNRRGFTYIYLVDYSFHGYNCDLETLRRIIAVGGPKVRQLEIRENL